MRLAPILNRPRRVMLLAAALSGAVLAAPLVAAELGMLDTLRKGSWDVRDRVTGAHSKVCVRSGRELVQLKHPGSNCERLVVDDTITNVTVQYTCRGQGYGHTQIRKESDRLVQIHTQGTEASRPFDITAEARYAGSC